MLSIQDRSMCVGVSANLVTCVSWLKGPACWDRWPNTLDAQKRSADFIGNPQVAARRISKAIRMLIGSDRKWQY
eukprot:11247114-Karenia_brevis.AAC.1